MSDLAAALARVPSPVGANGCRACGVAWVSIPPTTEPIDLEGLHELTCWWPPFVQARDALAAGVTVEGMLRYAGNRVIEFEAQGRHQDTAPFEVFKDGQRVTVTVRTVEASDATPSL